MSRSLRVLLVEDSEDDALLVLRALQTGGFQPEHERVETVAAMAAALAQKTWDIVISDYAMPKFSGVAALALLRQSGRDVPFIVVSGTIGEEVAVGMMQAGAHDYLIKGHLTRLVPAVERELQEAEQRRQRRQAERSLRESEERYRSLVEESPDMIGIFQENKLVFINSTGLRQLGAKAKEELLGSKGEQLIHPDDHPATSDRVRRRLAGETGIYPTEVRYQRLDGTTLPVEVIGAPITFGGKAAVQFIARDITARKRAEAALLKSEARLEEAQRIAHVGSWEWDAATDTPTWSKELCVILEVDPTKPAPSVAEQHKLYTPESMRRMHAAIEQAMRTVTPYEIELERVREDGKSRWLLARGEPVFNEQRQVTGLRGTALDITERKQAELALLAQEKRFRSLIEHSTDIISLLSPEAGLKYLSPAFGELLGFAPADWLDRSIFELIWPEDHPAAGALFKRSLELPGEVVTWQLRLRHQDGGWRWMEGTGTNFVSDPMIGGIVINCRDITERLRNERLALRTQRLESIGTLAGGIAHDLNNALAPIMMVVELLRMQYPGESPMLDIVQASAKRGAGMVKQLLNFAKGAEGERVPLQPGRLVTEMENLMKGSFPKNLQLVIKCDPQLPLVRGDVTQLHQVLLNLCVNARDAMPHGGTLTLEAERREVDAVYASSAPEAKPGQYVVLRVRDTGTGIPPEILDRIFEPFFSTKPPDKGTGMGLSTVMGIVKGHGGFLQVYSEPGQGSTFAAYLPAAGAGSDTEHVTKAAVEFRGQGETILFVDDERTLREVTSAVLRRLNFAPLTATDGADGLIQAALHRTQLHAIITDLHMPHMGGLEFVRALRRMLPDLPIMVASGRMEDAVAEEFQTLGVTNRLDKPFTEAQLKEALKNLLAPK